MPANNKPLIAANWKMYKTSGEARGFVSELAKQLQQAPELAQQADLLLCAQSPLLPIVKEALKQHGLPVQVGAQTMESHEEGAYTGEVSPKLLADLGIDAVILGHSERRQYYAETDQGVNAKTKAALQHGLLPIVCVGESLEQREAGETDAHVRSQVQAALEGISQADYVKLVFAYEPIWAIGTGKTCEAPEANRVCQLIKDITGAETRVLYGGSMKPGNAGELMATATIDGGLIGGASLNVDDYLAIARTGINEPANV